MATLLDIAPSQKTVTVSGVSIDVAGISTKGLVTLLTRFPQLIDLMKGGEFDVAALLTLSGEIVAAIIAAGTGHPGDTAMEERAGKLALGEQADLLAAIADVTMPGGVDPFVDRLTKLAQSLNLKPSTEKVPAAPLPNGEGGALSLNSEVLSKN